MNLEHRVLHTGRSQRRNVATVLSLATLIAVSAASRLPGQIAPRTKPGEVPWRQDIGAGRLTNPGRSQVLPPPDERLARLPTSADGRTNRGANDTSWWKEDAERTVGNPQHSMQGRGISPRGEIMLSTQIIAWVGSEAILAGDLLGRINEMLQAASVGKVPEEELDKQRWLLLERMLPSAIESKLVYLDFIKRMEPEQLNAIRDSVYEQFDEKQLPKLIEQAEVSNAAELEKRLRSYGTSIENVRRSFFEQVAAREVIRKKAEDNSEVTHDQLLEYWKLHSDQFAFKAKARWEHLMTRFDRFDSREEAYRAIAKMGNAVLRGAKFEVIARRDSQGLNAEQGGQYDWTTQGSLVSDVLDEAIFVTPVGEMSEILKDDDGYHIIRVIERQDAGYTPFVEAQVMIRDEIKEERRDAKVKEYLEKLKRETYVWNFFENR